MSKGKIFVGEVRLKSRSPETLKNPTILMSLVSVSFPHICISNAENRRLIVASVLEIFKKYSHSSYFVADSNFGTQVRCQTNSFGCCIKGKLFRLSTETSLSFLSPYRVFNGKMKYYNLTESAFFNSMFHILK